jgi:hypothetical protein
VDVVEGDHGADTFRDPALEMAGFAGKNRSRRTAYWRPGRDGFWVPVRNAAPPRRSGAWIGGILILSENEAGAQHCSGLNSFMKNNRAGQFVSRLRIYFTN